jgi:predicted RNA-binding Zn ribbon-like protein
VIAGYANITDGRVDEAFLLALLNTTPTIDGERTDAIADDAEARAWLATNFEGDPSAADLPKLRHARDVLQGLAHGHRDASAEVGALLEDACFRPRVGGGQLGWSLSVPADREPPVRAVLAWDALEKDSPGRLRPCANDECTLYLVDHSRNNSARWCSMAGCGNRLKARRHYKRQKS